MPKILRIANSLQTKLIVAFVALIVLIAGGTYLYTFSQTKKALLDGAREDLHQIIGIASTQFTPDEIALIQQFKTGDDGFKTEEEKNPSGEPTAEYAAIVEKLRNMRSASPTVSNFYIFQERLIDDGTGKKTEQWVFLVDDAEDEPARAGSTYDQPEAALWKANDGIQVSPDLYSDEFGTYLSGYAPIKGTSGETTLVIGADILAGTIVDRENFIGGTIYIVMGLAILVAALFIAFFALTIIRDIKRLNNAAEKISTGDTNVAVNVHRRDEIGELANSFGRMVASLKIMMGVGDDPEPEKSDSEGK